MTAMIPRHPPPPPRAGSPSVDTPPPWAARRWSIPQLGDTALKFALHYNKPEVAALLRATGAREPRAAAAGADVVKLKRSRRSSRRLSGGPELARR